MTRYSTMFTRLQQQNQGAFIPFVTLGDPGYQQSLDIIDTLVSAGADALELGFPFSDPLADGPTIQGANLRALQAGITPQHCFQLLGQVRQRYPELPIGLLLYANLVFNYGIDAFYQRCAATGIDSVLVADVPIEQSKPFRQAAMQHQVAPVFICPPNADDHLLRHIASYGRGYTYMLSRRGVTGTDNSTQTSVESLIQKLTDYQAAPVLIGFGIAQPGQVINALQSGAAGAITGSAIIKLIEHHSSQPETLHSQLHHLVASLKQATLSE